MADVRIEDLDLSDLPNQLPVMALRRGVLLPGAASPFVVGRASSRSALKSLHNGFLLIAAQREPVANPAPSDLLSTAVLARVVERAAGPQGAERVVMQGIRRVTLTGFPSVSPHFEATWQAVEEVWPDTIEANGMRQAFRGEIEASAEILGQP